MLKIQTVLACVVLFFYNLKAQQHLEIESKIVRNYLLSEVKNSPAMALNIGLNYCVNRHLYFNMQYTSGVLRGQVNKATFFQNNYSIYEGGIGFKIDSISAYHKLLAKTGIRISSGIGQVNNEVSTSLNNGHSESFTQPFFTYYFQTCFTFSASRDLLFQANAKINLTQSNFLDGVAGKSPDHIFNIGLGAIYRIHYSEKHINQSPPAVIVYPSSDIGNRLDKIDSLLSIVTTTVEKNTRQQIKPTEEFTKPDSTTTLAETKPDKTGITFPSFRYHVIIGGYFRLSPAIYFQEKLKLNGIETRLITKYNDGRLILVSAFETNNFDDALKSMKKLKLQLKQDAWIYINNKHH